MLQSMNDIRHNLPLFPFDFTFFCRQLLLANFSYYRVFLIPRLVETEAKKHRNEISLVRNALIHVNPENVLRSRVDRD